MKLKITSLAIGLAILSGCSSNDDMADRLEALENQRAANQLYSKKKNLKLYLSGYSHHQRPIQPGFMVLVLHNQNNLIILVVPHDYRLNLNWLSKQAKSSLVQNVRLSKVVQAVKLIRKLHF